MHNDKAAIEYKEGQRALFESSYRAIIFNIVMASVLSISLYYNNLPVKVVSIWLATVVVATIIRVLHCKVVIDKGLVEKSIGLHLKIFLLLTIVMGLTWSSIYFASIPFTNKFQLYIILMVCGGMAAGSTATLGVYMPAFYAYILAIFLPVISYNYFLWDFNAAIFATMFVWFLVAITIIAKSHQKLFRNVFFLSEQNKELMNKFEMLSITDSLTGLYNRRHFTKTLQDEFKRAKRNHHSFSLISIDVDNFKLINDNLGHPFGDQFLVYFANYLRSYLKRANDIIFRVGGDEFAILLLNTDKDITKHLCDTIKSHFMRLPKFEYTPQDMVHQQVLDKVSLSMGAVYVPFESKISVEHVIEQVDRLLYQSKHAGKNNINITTCL